MMSRQPVTRLGSLWPSSQGEVGTPAYVAGRLFDTANAGTLIFQPSPQFRIAAP